MSRNDRAATSLIPKLAALAALALAAGLPAALPAIADEGPLAWPEEQRAFFQDGPGLLFSADQRTRIEAMGDGERGAFIDEFLARDPDPSTADNELVEAIRRRRSLVRQEGLSPADVRAQLLFLHGPPEERLVVECGAVFRELEIWRYAFMGGVEAVVYRPAPTLPYRLWLPFDSMRALYTEEMEYWMLQLEELGRRGLGISFLRKSCSEAQRVTEATGIEGLYGFAKDRPTSAQLERLLDPPDDVAAWALAAVSGSRGEAPAELPVEELKILFPDEYRQRIVSRFFVTLPAGVELEPTAGTEEDEPELRLGVDGIVEQDGVVFDTFRTLFRLAPPGEEAPVALVVERNLRPGRTFLLRLRIRDEVGGAEAFLARAFTVPDEPVPVDEPPLPEEAVVALGEELAKRRIGGADSLVLVPPETDVVIGLWRAEALVTGERIQKVAFLVDGEQQLARSRPPFSVEIRLAPEPREQVVRAEGYDQDGELVAADEVVLNQPTGSLRVRILQPGRGVETGSEVRAEAEVVVPEGLRVESLEFLVNEVVQATLQRPPWEARVSVPEGEEVVYLTVVATLDDGSRAEDVRFLRAPKYLEEVEVNLVELYTTVTNRSGRLVKGLTREQFRVLEDGRPQEISRFELVEDLPLTLGITIDTSGSMAQALQEAQLAGRAFLDNLITPKDRYFVVAFSDRPTLVMAPTDDVTASEGMLEDLRSEGWTALHDAIVTSLYYFRGVRGRRAMVLLSDGDDTASSIAFREALEYARRSGVSIYTVGLNVGTLDVSVRRKLSTLAEETGGRSFFISEAAELTTVYDEIEDELRSQYLIAFAPDRPPTSEDEFREVEVEVLERGLKARTIRGYYP